MVENADYEIPFVSVVVCTYNRKQLLKSCLNSIYAQDFPQTRFEVIVIDGGSIDGTEEICQDYPNLQFIVEHKYGLAYARNKGAELAQGEIVAYTDDDCIVDKHWLRSLLTEFHVSKKVVGVGGPVYPIQPGIIPKKIHVNAAFGFFDEGKSKKQVNGVITSNSAFRKGLFKQITFDDTLGVTRRKGLILSGEDTDFCRQIIKSGFELRYTPYAKVYHSIIMERLRVQYVVKRALHSGITETIIYIKEKQSRLWAIRLSIGQLMKYVAKAPFDRSFVTCYNILHHLSSVIISLSCLDKIL